MLVTFSSKAWADITMFGDVAIHLLKLMGHSGTVPGALLAEDVPEALANLKTAVETEKAAQTQSEQDKDSEEKKVELDVRAYPLIELLTAAAKEHCDVMWDR